MGRLVFIAATALLTLILAAPAAAARATWTVFVPATGAIDVTPPRSDGQHVVAANGLLSLLSGTALTPFAQGPGGYSSGTGEPYIALSNGRRVRRSRCSFHRDDVFAIEPSDQPSVIRITPDGQAQPFAALPAGSFPSGGGDIGVESVGFIPTNARAGATAMLADRGGQAEPHPGSDAILGVKVGALLRAGARRGDLLAATEGGALTIAVRCARRCRVRRVGDGPPVAHAEGHIVFAPS